MVWDGQSIVGRREYYFAEFESLDPCWWGFYSDISLILRYPLSCLRFCYMLPNINSIYEVGAL